MYTSQTGKESNSEAAVQYSWGLIRTSRVSSRRWDK